MQIVLKAKSSTGEPYDVTFELKDDALSVHCTCKAGIMHTLCKHRVAFLHREDSMLFDPGQADALATACGWAQHTEFATLLDELDRAEVEVAKAKRGVSVARKKIGQSLFEGLRFATGGEQAP